MRLSVIIPSYKDPYLFKTIADLLAKSELGDELEVIAVFDGYWPKETLSDKRVRYIHLGKNRGMREAINAGVKVARGEFLMRTDEHCSFGQGYDRILTEQCKDNWIVTPRRYFLNPETWEVIDKPPVDYMKLKIVDCGNGVQKFSGVEARGDDSQPIQESQAMQGSCWVMPRKWWDEVIGELQTEGYGPLYQDSHEMVFKTWKKGGKLMVNKNTWHAHKHRSFSRTHNDGTSENPANKEAGWKYAIDVWGEYWKEYQEGKGKKTILYYSSNREDPAFEAKIIENLKAQAGDLPIISVTQKPLDLGTNICIGDKGLSYVNLFRQILIGAKAATTEYVQYAESDFLYPKEYFDFQPTEDVYLYDNVWIVDERDAFHRKIYSEGAQIVKRTLLIEKLEAFLDGKPEWFDGKLKLEGEEPFRHWKGGTPRFSGPPCLSFKTGRGVSKHTNTMDEKADTLPVWGTLTDIKERYATA